LRRLNGRFGKMWRVASSVPYLRRISASAIAALAKDRIVRIADLGFFKLE